MAFPFRGEEKHNQILEDLCAKHGFKTKSKVLLWVVENFDQIVIDRDTYKQRTHQLENEVTALKRAIENKFAADNTLLQLVSER